MALYAKDYLEKLIKRIDLVIAHAQKGIFEEQIGSLQKEVSYILSSK
ncbi:hypothetical protein GMD78_17490 [Ornithinibacillus sp. L9]|uniref:Uncharacterized protein n=1 Tax=Ornithinibacillus caprae TaxID=2678566 RepID=A0A6N8FQA9_9BACI|nr:hypothetical protein [Ornithinibacillus caprae]MUK90169.1 hypothetical protein [Ornithinibacillus caprae]